MKKQNRALLRFTVGRIGVGWGRRTSVDQEKTQRKGDGRSKIRSLLHQFCSGWPCNHLKNSLPCLLHGIRGRAAFSFRLLPQQSSWHLTIFVQFSGHTWRQLLTVSLKPVCWGNFPQKHTGFVPPDWEGCFSGWISIYAWGNLALAKRWLIFLFCLVLFCASEIEQIKHYLLWRLQLSLQHGFNSVLPRQERRKHLF